MLSSRACAGANTSKEIQNATAKVVSVDNRRLCVKNESSRTILGSQARPSSSSDRRLQPTMEKDGHVPIPSMKIQTSGNTKGQEIKTDRSGVSDTTVDNSTFVSNIIENEEDIATSTAQTVAVEHNRLAIIRNKRKLNRMKDDQIDFLEK